MFNPNNEEIPTTLDFEVIGYTHVLSYYQIQLIKPKEKLGKKIKNFKMLIHFLKNSMFLLKDQKETLSLINHFL